MEPLLARGDALRAGLPLGAAGDVERSGRVRARGRAGSTAAGECSVGEACRSSACVDSVAADGETRGELTGGRREPGEDAGLSWGSTKEYTG